MTRRKNVKRIDPRYFLNETVDREDDGSARDRGEVLEELEMPWTRKKREKAETDAAELAQHDADRSRAKHARARADAKAAAAAAPPYRDPRSDRGRDYGPNSKFAREAARRERENDPFGQWQHQKYLEEEVEFQDTGLQEDKAEHIQGVSDKIDRLRQAVKAAERGMENAEEAAQGDLDILMDIRTNNSYWAKQQEVSNLNDKISLLLKQLRQLQQDSPGQLKRGT